MRRPKEVARHVPAARRATTISLASTASLASTVSLRPTDSPFQVVAWLLPVGILALGGVLAALVALGLGHAFAAIVAWLPIDPADLDPLDALTAAFALGALAIGIARRKRLAWTMAVVAFAAAGVAGALTFSHPIGAPVAIVCLLLLARNRVRYRAATARAGRTAFAWIAICALSLLVVDSAVGDFLSGTWQQPLSDLRAVIGSIADALSFSAFDGLFGPSGALSRTGLIGPDLGGQVFDLLELAARVGLLLATISVLAAVSERPPDEHVVRRARRVGRRYGKGALLPFQLGPDVRQFLLPGQAGVVAYGQAGRMAVALGDPMGRPEAAWETFAAFVASRGEMDQIAAVYQASGTSRGMLAALGFRSIRVGMEAIVDLKLFRLEGSRRANLRHTVSRASRGGVLVGWYPDGVRGKSARPIREGMKAVDRAWLSRAGAQLRFTIHGFDPEELARRDIAVAVAREADKGISAFATFRPTGTDGGWVLDLIRRAPECTPGALESCIVEAAERLRDSGVPTLSLGLAPLYGLDAGAASREERFLAMIGRLVRPFYDVTGLAFFKSKFDPYWEPRYAAVRGRFDLLRLGVALLRLHLAGSGAGPLDAIGAALRAARSSMPLSPWPGR